jgi:hypothetical protein
MTFKSKRDAEEFAETMRVLDEGSAFVDNRERDNTISSQKSVPDLPEALTVGSIISQIEQVWRIRARLSNAERAFLTEFATAADRVSLIEDCFLSDAIEGGTM